MMSSLYFFDVDHTITDGSTGRRFAQAAVRRGLLKLRHLAMIPINFALYRLGGGGIAYFEKEFPILRGVEKARFEELGREVFARRTRKALRPEMSKLIESIKAEGGGRVSIEKKDGKVIVNEKEVDRARLELDDVIKIGSAKFLYGYFG